MLLITDILRVSNNQRIRMNVNFKSSDNFFFVFIGLMFILDGLMKKKKEFASDHPEL